MDVDAFASQLLEEAKRFLERAVDASDSTARDAYLHGALLLAFASLEAHLNSIADDFLVRGDLSILDRSTLSERDFAMNDGKWIITERLRIYRIEDRLQHLQTTFSTVPFDGTISSWSQLKEGLILRNKLTHPKQVQPITADQVRRAIEAIIHTLDNLYQAIYKRPLPAGLRGLSSTLNF